MRASVAFAALLAFCAVARAHDWNGIAIDGGGHLFVVDAEDAQVWRIDAHGKVEVFKEGTKRGTACPHTHHLAIGADGTLWMPSG